MKCINPARPDVSMLSIAFSLIVSTIEIHNIYIHILKQERHAYKWLFKVPSSHCITFFSAATRTTRAPPILSTQYPKHEYYEKGAQNREGGKVACVRVHVFVSMSFSMSARHGTCDRRAPPVAKPSKGMVKCEEQFQECSEGAIQV